MGRTRQAIPTGNFIFKNKANSKDKRIIYLRYYVNGMAVMTSTGVSIHEQDWDSEKESVTPVSPAYVRLNERLRKRKDEIDEQIKSYPGRLTPGILRDMMNGTYYNRDERVHVKHTNFIEYAFDYIQTSYNIGRIAVSTYHNDKHGLELFQRFVAQETGDELLPFKELTLTLIDRYKRHCLERGNKKSSINKKLKPIVKAIEHAAKNGIISQRQAYNICDDAYYDLRNRKYEADVDKESIRYLTEEQINEFINIYRFMSHERTREYMDMFLFAFYACGLRFSDILTLEWRHIDWERHRILKNSYKEKKRHSIPMRDEAMEILLRWKGKGYNGKFVFNLLPEYFDTDDAESLDMARKSKSKSVQVSLHAVGRRFQKKLPFNLSFHVARHSFAVFALSRGVELHQLSELMGHRSIFATEKYYARFIPHEISQEVIAVLSKAAEK